MTIKKILFILCSVCMFSCTSCSESTEPEALTLQLDQAEMTLNVGETADLTITEAPSVSGTVEWSSSNETVATVFMGTVTALASGSATITVQMGTYVDSCVVTVPERIYTLVWSDEFDGTSLDTANWNIEVNGNGGGNNEEQYYTARSENIRVADGYLCIEALKEDYEGKEYTSGRITTKNKQDFTYGKVEARLKVPKGTGTWPAFWMLGYGGWPNAGEIDIMEHVGYDPKTFHCALHTDNYNGTIGNNQSGSESYADDVANDFHVITMEWVENELQGYDRIHISIDGEEIKVFGETAQLQESGDWPFNNDFYIILNLAIGGNWGGVQGVDDTMFNDAVLYQIDYVRVYQLQ